MVPGPAMVARASRLSVSLAYREPEAKKLWEPWLRPSQAPSSGVGSLEALVPTAPGQSAWLAVPELQTLKGLGSASHLVSLQETWQISDGHLPTGHPKVP